VGRGEFKVQSANRNNCHCRHLTQANTEVNTEVLTSFLTFGIGADGHDKQSRPGVDAVGHDEQDRKFVGVHAPAEPIAAVRRNSSNVPPVSSHPVGRTRHSSLLPGSRRKSQQTLYCSSPAWPGFFTHPRPRV